MCLKIAHKLYVKGHIFYVSANGNDAWSGRLAKVNGSRTDGPFASIRKARDAIRDLKDKEKLRAPVSVYIRNGFYQLPEPLVFSSQDSGTLEGPIIYMAYPGETPVLSGGRKITGWKKGKGDMWIAEIPEVKKGRWYFRQLFVNGKRRYRSRMPKKGFYRVVGLPGVNPKGPYETPCRQFRFAPGDLKSDWTNLSDVEIVVLHSWVDVHLPVATIDETDRIVIFTRSSRRQLYDDYLMKKGARYYVDNVFENLSQPGEWYLNRKRSLLYYLPKSGEEPNCAEIIAPQLASLIRFEGNPESERFVEYITLRGLTLSHNGWELPADDAGDCQAAHTVPGALYGRGMRNCTIEQCNLKNIGTYGIELSKGCHQNQLIRNEISEAGGGGIKISGGREIGPEFRLDENSPFSLRTANNQITDNYLHHLGQIYPSAVGILARHTSGNNISHNHIHNLYYSGISVGWVWGYGWSVSWDNRIEFNYIHDIGQGVLSDMGGIYLLGVSPGTAVRNNLIHGVKAHSYGGKAIYLDQGSSHIVIENNICYDTSHAVFFHHLGRENTIRNNIFAFGRAGQVQYSVEEHSDTDFTFERNIIISDGQILFLGCDYRFRDIKVKRFISDLNLFWDISSKKSKPFARIEKKILNITDWQKIGYDLHSVIADPGCKNYRKRNFILKKNSPAWKLGFRPIDMHQVGPRQTPKAKRQSGDARHLFSLSRETTLRLLRR